MKITENESAKAVNSLREANMATQGEFQNCVLESLRGEIQERYQLDITKESTKKLLDFKAPRFSIKDFRESVYRHCRNVREADSEGAVSQLLRTGIQLAVNAMYQNVPTNYEKFVDIVPSTKLIELYAPLYAAGFIKKLAHPNDEPAELSIKGMDIQVKTDDYAGLLTISKTMIDDDQTSQLTKQAASAGERAKILKDSICFVRWLSKTGGVDAGGNAVSNSATGAQAGETTWPWNVAFTNGGGQNRLTTYLAASYQALINGRLLARQMKDPKGNKMLVMPNLVICGVGVSDMLHEIVDGDSQFYPSSATMKQADANNAGTDTNIGTSHAKNLLKGGYEVVESIWLPNKAYGIMQAGKGFLLQQREPLAVLQESPVSGPAFTCQLYRWRIGERYIPEWLEPRFGVLCSDGTA